MERLSGLDAGFLYLETPSVFMHTLKLVLLDPAPPSVDVRAALVEGVKRRIHRFPKLRRRLLDVPFGLHHPLWIETSVLNYELHVLERAVPAPAGRWQLEDVVADIASWPLDRTRPLWELWVLKGSADAPLAILLKIHHALADGAAAAELIAAVTSHHPHDEAEEVVRASGPCELVPPPLSLLRAAATDHFREMEALPELVLRTTKSALSLLSASSRIATPRPMLDVPRTSINGAVSPRRSLATVSLSLPRVLAVKSAAGVTLNDVVLAIVGSALRHYLTGRGELPSRPLVASVPIASEPNADHRMTGNRVSSLFTTLATDLEDPWERLQRIHEVTREAKHVQAVMGAQLLASWLQYTLPLPFSWVISQWSKRHLAAIAPAPVNVVISNVHGPSELLYAGKLPLRAVYSVGPVLEGIGLNITVWSYLDQLHFTVLACRELVPNPRQITAQLDAALTELAERADLFRVDATSPPRKEPLAATT